VAGSAPEVLIAGGGPAGATAARRLARAGVRVLLVDRAHFPRNKPCGGAISMRALRRFPYLADALSGIDTHLISRLHLESPGGSHVLLTSDRPAALMIRRVAFDHLLLTLAREAGAEIVEDAEIDWTEPAVAVDRRIRACTPGPGAWSTYAGERVKVGPVALTDGRDRLEPGVLEVTKQAVFVGTATDPVQLGEVKAFGKKQMQAADWARGVRLSSGETLGG